MIKRGKDSEKLKTKKTKIVFIVVILIKKLKTKNFGCRNCAFWGLWYEREEFSIFNYQFSINIVLLQGINKKIMATTTLEYNARNNVANRIIDIIIVMDNVFKIKTHVTTGSGAFTRKAIQDVEKGNVITCETYEDYLKETAQYA